MDCLNPFLLVWLCKILKLNRNCCVNSSQLTSVDKQEGVSSPGLQKMKLRQLTFTDRVNEPLGDGVQFNTGRKTKCILLMLGIIGTPGPNFEMLYLLSWR